MTCTNPDCAYCGWLRAFSTGMGEVRTARLSGDSTDLAIARRARATSRQFLREYPGCQTKLMGGAR